MRQRTLRGLARRRILIEAFACTLSAWITVRLRPYGSWRDKLGTPVSLIQERTVGPSARVAGVALLRDIAWAHDAVARLCGQHATCLMLAFSARKMLRDRGLPSLLVLGVKRGGAQTAGDVLGAHAWVLCQGY